MYTVPPSGQESEELFDGYGNTQNCAQISDQNQYQNQQNNNSNLQFNENC